MKPIKLLTILALLGSLSACEEDFLAEESEIEQNLTRYLVETEMSALEVYNIVDRALTDEDFIVTDSTTMAGAWVKRTSELTIRVDFGNGAVGTDGVLRQGVIDLTLNDPDYNLAATEVKGEFLDFSADDRRFRGTFTITNLGDDDYSLILEDFDINSEFRLNSEQTISWEGGRKTPEISDDTYQVAGSALGEDTKTGDEVSLSIPEKIFYDRGCSDGLLGGVIDMNFTAGEDREVFYESGAIDFLLDDGEEKDGCNNLYELTLTNTDGEELTVTGTFENYNF